MVMSMWKLLGELAMQYCDLAAWSIATGQPEAAVELVAKARACLVRRGLHKEQLEIELTDVLQPG
jgi:hypothetical protein